MAKKLWKTTIVIWSDYDPSCHSLESLAREAILGDAYCSYMNREFVEDIHDDEHWDDNDEFFWDPDDE